MWLRLTKFCADRGYTRKQAYASMRNHWPEGPVWTKAPNGRIYIDPDAHDNWVAGNPPVNQPQGAQ